MLNNFLKIITDFSSNNSLSKAIISTLFNVIKDNDDYLIYYSKWKNIFTFLHGELNSQRKININDIKIKYGVEIQTKEDVFRFAYTLEIYYSVLLKLIAFRKLNCDIISVNLFKEVVNGSYYVKKNILNYFSPDYYNFVEGISEIQLLFVNLLDVVKNNPKIEDDYDFIKILYEELFPRELRHSMGEFYTPDWLAEFTIKKLLEDDSDANLKLFLDPTCGSGTFLFSLVRIYRKKNINILSQIFGVDINPLAVLAAKTNYILFLNESPKNALLLPFFNTDIIKHPKYQDNDLILFNNANDQYNIKINGISIIIKNQNYDLRDVYTLYKSIILYDPNAVTEKLLDIYKQIYKLGINEKSIFLDRFALLALENIDYIVGNPPWVNWEYLPKEYKKETEKVWQYYDLFKYKGLESIFIKEDISALVTYVAIDNHLKDYGKVAFILKESLFKSSKQGAGFRKFIIPKSKTNLCPYVVYDLTKFSPFTGVNNKTFILFLTKNKKWKNPVKIIEWIPKGKKTFGEFDSESSVVNSFDFQEKLATPINRNDLTSGWITLNKLNNIKIEKYIGKPEYKARTGVFSGGANAIYWINVITEINNNTIEIENITKRAKNKCKSLKTRIEKEFVFPLITGSDISLWNFKYSKYIILPHNSYSKMYPINKEELSKFPLTVDYFEGFKEELTNRKGFTSFDRKIHLKYYYSLQRIGDYTFKPYKVAWRYIAKEFLTCVIESVNDQFLGNKNLIPNEKVIYIGLDNKEEAYYLCGLLSSRILREIINSFTVNIQISPSTISNLKLEKYNNQNPLHKKLSHLCCEGHISERKETLLDEIDEIVEILYEII